MLWRLWTLIIKEFQAIWRDKKCRYVLIVPPIIQTLLFAYAATLEVKDAAIAVCNLDNGRCGRELVQRLQASSSFRNVTFLQAQEEMRPAIDNRDALLAVAIPQDFSSCISGGRATSLQVLLDGRRSNSAQIAQNYLDQIVLGMQADLTGQAPPVEVVIRTWFNANKDYQWFTVPGLVGIIMALEVMLLTGLSVARERELGTFEQLQVSPLSPGEIILGKTVPALLIGLAEGTLIVLMALFLFGIPFRGAFSLLYLGMFLYVLAMTGVGLFVSSIVQTQQQAFLGTFVAIMPTILLSGFLSPVENMPHWLQVATVWNPLRYFLIIVKGVFLKALPLNLVLYEALPLILIAACTLSISVWSFRRRLN